MGYIDTDSFSKALRKRAIKLDSKKILIARLAGSDQEKDFTSPTNCGGYGRTRHFRLNFYPDWSKNPLPIVPAAKALGYPTSDILRAQVFQNAACNWRCWYCFVDFDRLSADTRVSEYFTSEELIDLYLKENNRPHVIDLTGGQPDIVPEWTLWMMESLQRNNLMDKVFLWSDDNLSTRFFWQFLTGSQRHYIASFPKYSRVGCFKGYDGVSFSFNTKADPVHFTKQFEIFQELLNEGFDMYAYTTFTSPPHDGLRESMSQFVDKLQAIHPNLPLRTVPLKVDVYTPTSGRMNSIHEQAIRFQLEAHSVWIEEIEKRFDQQKRALAICDVSLM